MERSRRKVLRCLVILLSVILGVLVFLSLTGTVAYAAGLVDNTVSVTINRLRRKISPGGEEACCIKNVFGFGYRIDGR